MVVGCPYILIPGRTQLSGPRFPSLTILIFSGLARLLSPSPCQIDRKWAYLSHLRTRASPAYPAWGGAWPVPTQSAAGRVTHPVFCVDVFRTPSIHSTPSTPPFHHGTSSA